MKISYTKIRDIKKVSMKVWERVNILTYFMIFSLPIKNAMSIKWGAEQSHFQGFIL